MGSFIISYHIVQNKHGYEGLAILHLPLSRALLQLMVGLTLPFLSIFLRGTIPMLKPLKGVDIVVFPDAGFGKGVFPLSIKSCSSCYSQISTEVL